MDLRVTPQTQLNSTLSHLDQHTTRLARLQEQAATGMRILSPSDQPADVPSLLASKAQDGRLENYLTNIRNARSTLDISTSALGEVNTILSHARTLALEGSQSTNDANARASLAQEMDGLLKRLVDLVNTQHNGTYVFGGTAIKAPPYTITYDSQDRPLSIAYQGSDQRGEVPIGPRQTVDTLYPGSEVFQRRQRDTTIFTGATGATPGTGTDSATGTTSLLVTHTTTTYAAGSGVLTGTGSAAGDSIIGPAGAHQLTIVDTSGTGAGGTVSLNGGPPVAFTNADANLQITGPAGEVVFIRTTAITPGFSGTVDITANGTLSVDGGVTSMPITFAANQVVTHGATGAVTNVNSTNIRAAGTTRVENRGTYDVFQILITLRDDLRNVHQLAERPQLEAISQRVAELDRLRGNVLETLGEQSASLQNLEGLEQHLQNLQLSTRKLIGELEDADISALVIQLQAQQNLLQLTLASTARLFDQNLLDFLR